MHHEQRPRRDKIDSEDPLFYSVSKEGAMRARVGPCSSRFRIRISESAKPPGCAIFKEAYKLSDRGAPEHTLWSHNFL